MEVHGPDSLDTRHYLFQSGQKLGNLLNQTPQSQQDILDTDYCARAGFVKDDIIGTIQRYMLQKFPGEPVPAFDDAASDTAIIAYAFIEPMSGSRFHI